MSFLLGKKQNKFLLTSLIEKESVLKEKWILTIGPVLESVNISLPEGFDQGSINGRNGEHTEELEEALSILAEVYDLNPAASW